MKMCSTRVTVLLAGLLIVPQLASASGASGKNLKKKEDAVAPIERHKAEIFALSDQARKPYSRAG